MRTTRLRHGGSELRLGVTDGLLFLAVEEDGAVARIELPVPVMTTMIRAVDDGARRGGDAGDGWGSAASDDDGWRGRPGSCSRSAGATIIPFPRPAPPPARSGLPWTAAHDAAVRTAWLAAAPDADRAALLAAIARAVERGIGGVVARLARLGCDPACPGRVLPGGPHRPAI